MNKPSLAGRVASMSPRVGFCCNVGLAAVVGGLAGLFRGVPTVFSYALVMSGISAGQSYLLRRKSLAPLRDLPGADRAAVIDAVRFGTAVHDPHLVEPLLALTARRARCVTPQRVRACVVAYILTAGWSVFVAARLASAGHAADAVAWTTIAGLLLLVASFLPNLGRAVRRTNEAAESANCPGRSLVGVPTAGSR
jgi:hypothetical protein